MAGFIQTNWMTPRLTHLSSWGPMGVSRPKQHVRVRGEPLMDWPSSLLTMDPMPPRYSMQSWRKQ